MNWKKIFRRTLAALIIVMVLLTAAIVGAAVQMFDGYGECEMGEFASLGTIQNVATQRAKLDAQKQAGVYLKTFSRSVNSELSDDEISSVTNDIIEIVGDIKHEKKFFKLTDQTTAVVIVASLKAKIDPEGIYNFINLKNDDKVKFVQQNKSSQNAIQKTDNNFENLKEQYKQTDSQSERENIREQIRQVDQEFLVNQLFSGYGEYYMTNFDKNLLYIVIAVDPLYPFERSMETAYIEAQKKAALDVKTFLDLIKVNINDDEFSVLMNYAFSLSDGASSFKTIKENEILYSELRGKVNPKIIYDWINFNEKEKAVIIKQNKDLQNIISRNDVKIANLIEKYNHATFETETDSLVTQIRQAMSEHRSNLEMKSANRAYYSKSYGTALIGYSQAISRNPNNFLAYYNRGLCYQALDDEESAQADFAKAKELGYNG